MLRRTFVSIFSLLIATVSLAATPATNPRVEIKTSEGTMIVELYAEQAPKSVANFSAVHQRRFLRGNDISSGDR